MTERIDIGAALREVDELNEVCWALREGYLREHPDAEPNVVERLYVEAALTVRQRTGADETSYLGVLPRSLRERLAHG
ncbi:MAG: hypothetical protein H0W72_11325 [Planctomycetes bacterium]|nr:hypothetical protein [Planctomycetota bacterium]